MYNEKIKFDYLGQLKLPSIEKTAYSIFNNNLQYEEYFRKDFCNFVRPEIIEYFTALRSVAFESLNTKCSILRGYTQWCIENNLSSDNINHYDEISRDDLRSCLNKSLYKQKFVSLDELREICKEFINVSDKALCYCIFFGIYGNGGEDIKELSGNCIDIDSGYIKLSNGKEVNVPSWVAEVFKESCETYEYYTYKDNGDLFEMKLQELDPTVFKGRNNMSISDDNDSFKARITRRLRKLNIMADCIALTAKRLKNSGMIWQIKNLMQKKNLTIKEAYEDKEVKNIVEWYGLKYPHSFHTFNNLYGTFLE